MDIKKWVPWNWFKKEEEEAEKAVPVNRQSIDEFGWGMDSPFTHLHREIDRLFNQTFRGFGNSLLNVDWSFSPQPQLSYGMLKPTLDVGATDKDYAISMEIPGVDEKDIKLEISNDTLTICGEKRHENVEKSKNYYRMERTYGSFKRVLSLPTDVDQDNITATFNKGVLTVTAPRKTIPKPDVKQIAVQSA